VSRHLHRDALRDAGADEIADGRSSEVVQDATGASGLGTRRPERDPEALDGPARAVEHVRADDLELPLEIFGGRSLPFKHFTQLARHREGPSLAVLRLSRIEPHFVAAKVDLPPLQRQDLAVDPPTGDVREGGRRSNGLRQVRQHGQELFALEEADADVVFLEEPDVRLLQQFPRLDRQG
jgi:hypothetical protein